MRRVMTEMIEERRFTCPSCGSHAFGTADFGRTGHCNGYQGLGQPCRFTWQRVDDALYFKGTGAFHPTEGTAQAVPRP